MKLNLGAGHDIRPDHVNHDLAALPGIAVVHDLNRYPWPWPDASADEIVARDLLEHLDDFMAAMEEIHRILKPGAIARIKVPYWNSWCRHADPTHKRGFHELTFRFFDPDSPYCAERHYYSKARFRIESETFVLAPLSPYFSVPGLREIYVRNRWLKRLTGLIGNTFSNVILDLDLLLRKPGVPDNDGRNLQ
jgi:SAM-dependent methyltransferase